MNVRSKLEKSAFIAAAILAPAFTQAEDVKWYEKTKVSGFADAYYKYNFDGRKGSAAATVDKVFDLHQNNIALGGGKLSLAASDGMAVVDLYFGDYAAVLQPTVVAASTAVGQAYIAQAFGPITATLGRYFTHVGWEVADSVNNTNFTRGLLYNSVPFYHQGLKLTYSPMEGLGLMAMLDNGNSANYPTAEETAAGAQISYSGITGLSTYLNYYYQPVYVTSGLAPVWEKSHFFDVCLSYVLMEGLTFSGEYLYTTQIGAGDTNTAGDVIGSFMLDPSNGKRVAYSPKTQGYAVYLDYATPVEGLSITPRFEALYTPDNKVTKFDYTLTARHIKGAVTNWLELRADASDDAIYPAPVKEPGNASYNEMALTWGVGYKF